MQSALTLNHCESLHLRQLPEGLSLFCLRAGEAEGPPLLAWPDRVQFNSMLRLSGGRALIKTNREVILLDRDNSTLKLRTLFKAPFDDSFCYESLSISRRYPDLLIFTLTKTAVVIFKLKNFLLRH